MSIVTNLRFTANIDSGVVMTPLKHAFLTHDQEAHCFEVSCYRLHNRETVDLTGAGVKGYFIRADGQSVVIDGTASGNVASVTLPAECYAQQGRFALVIKASMGDTIATLLWAEGAVSRSRTDVIVDPGNIIPSLDELLAKIDELEAATANANAATEAANSAAAEAVEIATSKGDEALQTVNDAVARQDEVISQLTEDIEDMGRLSVSFTDGSFVNCTNGKIVGDTRYSYSDYINVQAITGIELTAYFSGNYSGVAFYTADKVFVRGINNTTGTFGAMLASDVNNGEAYVRVTCFTANLGNFEMYGSGLAQGVANLGKVVNEQIAAAKTELNISITKNTEARRIPVTFTAGKYVLPSGNLADHTSFSYSNDVDVGGLDSIVLSKYITGVSASIVLLDEQKRVTRSFNNNGGELGAEEAIELAENERYIRITAYTQHVSKFYMYATNLALSVVKANKAAEGDYFEPFSKIIRDGGMVRIFDRIGVVGDSLSSGEMAYADAVDESTTQYVDMLEYSWIQYLARECGTTAYNFSQGGLNTRNFLSGLGGHLEKLQNPDYKCKAYFIALGHNDANYGVDVGSAADINMADYTQNADTYYGNYARIISIIKTVQPNAKIFVICMKSSGYAAYNEAIRYMATIFSNVYVLDFENHHPLLETSWEYTQGHGNAMGYLNYSWQIGTYVDWIIRHNRDEFKYVQFIGTDYAQYIP